MTYDSIVRAAVFTALLTLGMTGLWFVAVPVTDAWLREWLVHPPHDIALWQRSLRVFASSWPKAWPVFVVVVWVVSFLPIELVRRIKARRT